MKKQLIGLLITAAFSSASMANSSVEHCEKVQPTKEAIQMNFHSNYLPNLIPVLLNSEKELNLSQEQCRAFNQIRAKKGKAGKAMMKQLASLEAESMRMALAGATMEEIQNRHKKIAELRAGIVEGKMKCHQLVKEQLSEAQYAKLTQEIYPKMYAKAQQKIQ